jgi:hypothetical protein
MRKLPCVVGGSPASRPDDTVAYHELPDRFIQVVEPTTNQCIVEVVERMHAGDEAEDELVEEERKAWRKRGVAGGRRRGWRCRWWNWWQ